MMAVAVIIGTAVAFAVWHCVFPTLMGVLNLDGYDCLWDKFHDPDRDVFREERKWAYDEYVLYKNIVYKEKDFDMLRAMKQARADKDYIKLYKLQRAVDGEIEAIEWLKKEEY